MLSVIVPTYNERDNARALLERVQPVFADLGEAAELLVVDDDSPDGTADAFRSAAADLGFAEHVRVIVRSADRGLAKAVCEGFRAARGDVLAVMDADLSHPPELLPAMLAPIRADTADITVGSRRVPGGGVENWPWSRRFTSWSASLLARPLVPVRDTTSGLFALRADLLDGVDLVAIGYKIGLEVWVRTGTRRVAEVPFTFPDRTQGESKLGGGAMLAYLVQLVSLYRVRFPTAARYMQYAFVGLLGVLVHALTYALLVRVLASTEPRGGAFVAHVLAFAAAVWSNFLLNRRWTFHESATGARLDRYAAICVGGQALRSLVMLPFLAGTQPHPGTVLGMGGRAGVVLGLGLSVASVWNFLASRRWAFPEASRAVSAPALDGPARSWMLRALVLAGALHLLFAGAVGLSTDEAYYWQWARAEHLATGYFDHPPMVAYFVAAGTALAGINEVGVRLGTVLLHLGLAWAVFRITVAYVRATDGTPAAEPSPRAATAGLWAAGAVLCAPLLVLSGLLTTPDAPLLFFWAATVLATLRALRTERLRAWLLVGVPLGLGVLSKYSMAFLALSLPFALLMSPRGRRALRTPGPYLAAALGIGLCMPYALWMLENDLGGIQWQLDHGLDRGSAQRAFPPLVTLGRYVGAQALFVTPLLWGVVMVALAGAAAKMLRPSRAPGAAGDLDRALRPVLVLPAAAVLVLFGIASLSEDAEANWAVVAYPTAFALAGPVLARWAQRPHVHRRRLAVGGIIIALFVSAGAYAEMTQPVLFDRGVTRKVGLRRPMARRVDAARVGKGAAGLAAPVVGASYRTASLLAFYLPDRPLTAAPFEWGSGEQYALWESETPLRAGDRAWFVARWPIALPVDDDGRVTRLLRDPVLVARYEEVRFGRARHAYCVYWGVLRGEPIARKP